MYEWEHAEVSKGEGNSADYMVDPGLELRIPLNAFFLYQCDTSEIVTIVISKSVQ